MIKIVKDLGMRYSEKAKRNHRWCLVECPDCGIQYETMTKNAKSIKRCKKCADTIASEKRVKHGGARRENNERLYSIWRSMKSRCYGENNTSKHLYQDKGVTVCKEWKNSYSAFKKWALANNYNEELVLDKDYLCELHSIEPKQYSPETCRWITHKENSITNKKLSTEDYLYIQKHFKPDTDSYKVLAQKFDITERHIYDILKYNLTE